jgi:hypothetical protein
MVQLIYSEFNNIDLEKNVDFSREVVNGVQDIQHENEFNSMLSGDVFLCGKRYFADSWLDGNRFELYIHNYDDHVRLVTFVFRIERRDKIEKRNK